jgi:hypothetical protein
MHGDNIKVIYCTVQYIEISNKDCMRLTNIANTNKACQK